MENIFNKIPFNSYDDLFNAIRNGKATIKIMRSDCSQIAGIKHPYFSTIGMYVGFLITLFFLIFLSIKLRNFWLLLIIPINFILNLAIVYFKRITTIAWIILVLDLFIFKLQDFVLILCLDIICISFFYNIWWNIIYKQAIDELQCNKKAFLWSWDRCGLTIEDCYGNNYNKLTIKEKDINEKYIQLSNIVMKSLNTTSIDEALLKAYEFYKDAGYDLMDIDINNENKYKTIAQLISKGLETNTIDETIEKAIEFYKNQNIKI